MPSVRFERSTEKFVLKLKDKTLIKRILRKIEELKEEPFPSEAVRVEEYKKDRVFRVRVVDYRILYYVDYEKSLII
jgi:mRNA-degrading endonuclease RelE of RelBE toxin-antitoxin system